MEAWKEKIRYRLEEQSKQLEDVLSRYRMTAVVTGGVVYSSVFEFNIQGATRRISNQLTAVQDEMAVQLNVPEVEIICRPEQMTVRVRQWNSCPLNLLDLMKSVGEVRPLTMILGASTDGRPLVLHLPSADVSNILIVGSYGAGKTSLLRALLFSLAARNKQHQMQVLVIDYDPAVKQEEPSNSSLDAFSHLPHLVEPVATTLPQAIQLLDFLVEELAYRQEKWTEQPKILLLIDNLDSLLAAGQETLLNRLIHLLQYGEQVGIHLILAMEKPAGPFTNTLLKCDFPIRFIGHVRNKKMARAAAGIPETGAEHLQGQGDFIAVKDGQLIRFHTAYISDYDLYLAVDKLSRQKRKKIVVKPSHYASGLSALTNNKNLLTSNIVP